MNSIWLTLATLLFSITTFATTDETLNTDLATILTEAQLDPTSVSFDWSQATTNQVYVLCQGEHVHLVVSSTPEEEVSTFYYGLHKLGFLFPHPRQQISPSTQEILSHCGADFTWQPSLKRRGFHLHTQHPSEWLSGFFEGNTKIVHETVLWMARNFQNMLQLELIQGNQRKLGDAWRPEYNLMKDLQIEMGLSVSFVSQQQHAATLIPLLSALTGIDDEHFLKKNLHTLADKISFDYVVLEFGTSEFTSTNYNRTIEWLKTACHTLQSLDKKTYAVSHVSTGQTDPKLGNFNFLTQYVDSCLGSYVHTVMDYGLDDPYTPVYGRTNFDDTKAFALEQQSKRSVIYYPETSYFVGMDIDVPIFLTDYLVARARDYQWAAANGLDGQVNFSTGQELGYWLFDWNLALQANQEYLGDPLAAVKLLGEDAVLWQSILDFQTEYLKTRQGLQYLSTSNLLDELYSKFMIHRRTLLRDLASRPQELATELATLVDAVAHEPSLAGVKNFELRNMLMVTWLRMEHALYLRKAIENPEQKSQWLDHALFTHQEAAAVIEQVLSSQRYFDAIVFEKRSNPTSYGYGYGWVATKLFFWTREEEIVRQNETNPFFMNIYNPIKLLF